MDRCYWRNKHKKGANHEQDHQQHLEDSRPGGCRRNSHGNPEGPGRSRGLPRRSSRHRRSGYGHGNCSLRYRAGPAAASTASACTSLGASASTSAPTRVSTGTSATASGVPSGASPSRAAQDRPQGASAACPSKARSRAKEPRKSPGQAPVGKYEVRSTNQTKD